MKCIYAVVAFLSLHFLVHAQEFQYFATRDGVDIASKYGENAVTLQFKNKNNQKVYVSTGDVLWFQGEIMVGKANGGGLTLAPGETSSFGMFFIYPKGYDSKNYQSLRFRISSIRVEIGGMGNDPRYQKAQTKSNNSTVVSGQGLPELDFNKGATREPGSNEWKAMPPSNEIKFPGDDKTADQKTNATQSTSTDKMKPSNNQSSDPNIKMNGLYYSNGTATQKNVTANNTENANQKQQYQNQADNYLNKAQDKIQSSISQNLDLDLAKTNAIMAGDHQQVEQIQEKQNQQRQQANEQLIQGFSSLSNTVFDLISNRKAAREQQLANLDKTEKMFLIHNYLNNFNDLYSENYTSYTHLRPYYFYDREVYQVNNSDKIRRVKENISSGNYCEAYPLSTYSQLVINEKRPVNLSDEDWFFWYGNNRFLIYLNEILPVKSFRLQDLRSNFKDAEKGSAYAQYVCGLARFHNLKDFKVNLTDSYEYFKNLTQNTEALNSWKKIGYYLMAMIKFQEGIAKKEVKLINESISLMDSAYIISFESAIKASAFTFTNTWLTKNAFNLFQTDIVRNILSAFKSLNELTQENKYCKNYVWYYLNYPSQSEKDVYETSAHCNECLEKSTSSSNANLSSNDANKGPFGNIDEAIIFLNQTLKSNVGVREEAMELNDGTKVISRHLFHVQKVVKSNNSLLISFFLINQEIKNGVTKSADSSMHIWRLKLNGISRIKQEEIEIPKDDFITYKFNTNTYFVESLSDDGIVYFIDVNGTGDARKSFDVSQFLDNVHLTTTAFNELALQISNALNFIIEEHNRGN